MINQGRPTAELGSLRDKLYDLMQKRKTGSSADRASIDLAISRTVNDIKYMSAGATHTYGASRAMFPISDFEEYPNPFSALASTKYFNSISNSLPRSFSSVVVEAEALLRDLESKRRSKARLQEMTDRAGRHMISGSVQQKQEWEQKQQLLLNELVKFECQKITASDLDRAYLDNEMNKILRANPWLKDEKIVILAEARLAYMHWMRPGRRP